MASPKREQLIALTEPLLGQLGYELVDLEYVPGRTRALLRVFIDKPQGNAAQGNAAQADTPQADTRQGDEPQGVGLDDCERVSHELSALFDIEDPVPMAYTLEVSSPGLDRVLRTRAHFERFMGERIWVELKVARAGRRRYTGRLTALNAQDVELDVDGAIVRVPFDEISRARLAPQ